MDDGVFMFEGNWFRNANYPLSDRALSPTRGGGGGEGGGLSGILCKYKLVSAACVQHFTVRALLSSPEDMHP